jgi:2-hydroxy-3-keto-5-methylthiopentenyl-1-phosphate phosphatase
MGKPWAAVLDFDGTVTLEDVADSLLLRFGALGEREIEDSYRPGVLTEEWVARAFSRVRSPWPDLRRFVLESARMRPGFPAFVDACRRRGVIVEIVSGGLDFYLDLLLEKWGLPDLPRYCARTRRTRGGLSVRYPFLQGETLEAFKLRRVLAARSQGRRVLFAGDGTSDLSAARSADAVFARGHLLRHCRRLGLSAAPLRTFAGPRRVIEPCSRP